MTHALRRAYHTWALTERLGNTVKVCQNGMERNILKLKQDLKMDPNPIDN